MKDEDGTLKASIFYVAYTRDGLKDPGDRPVTFSFNAALERRPCGCSLAPSGAGRGPDGRGNALPPPGRLVDNESSILDVTDLVFIDPVSTATAGRCREWTQAVPRHQADIESVGEFIRL